MKGNLYIISAPSGAGKTSLVRKVMEQRGNVCFSISHTTRDMRPGEKDGFDYHFIDTKAFEDMTKKNAFIEYAQVFDNLYGTSHASVEDQLAKGKDVVLDIDWQGARQIRTQLPHAINIFILPPSKQALDERLHARGQDSEEIITRRMQSAMQEMSHYDEYQYLIINDDFDTAVAELDAIMCSKHLTIEKQSLRHQHIINDLLS